MKIEKLKERIIACVDNRGNGSYVDAIILCDKLLETDDSADRLWALKHKKIAYSRLNDYDNELKVCHALIDLYETTGLGFPYYADRAMIYLHQKKYGLALIDFNKAIKLNPTLDLYLSRAKCYVELGKKEEALHDIAEVKVRMEGLQVGYKKDIEMQVEVLVSKINRVIM
jgi:tetratricopeptide (TPR) repeat protein